MTVPNQQRRSVTIEVHRPDGTTHIEVPNAENIRFTTEPQIKYPNAGDLLSPPPVVSAVDLKLHVRAQGNGGDTLYTVTKAEPAQNHTTDKPSLLLIAADRQDGVRWMEEHPHLSRLYTGYIHYVDNLQHIRGLRVCEYLITTRAAAHPNYIEALNQARICAILGGQ